MTTSGLDVARRAYGAIAGDFFIFTNRARFALRVLAVVNLPRRAFVAAFLFVVMAWSDPIRRAIVAQTIVV